MTESILQILHEKNAHILSTYNFHTHTKTREYEREKSIKEMKRNSNKISP